ncbi:MAG: FecR family protein [Cytophagales bacterium]
MEKQDLDKKILDSSSHFEVEENLTKMQAWERLRSEIDFEPKTVLMKMPILKWAASIIVILGISFFVLKSAGTQTRISGTDIIEIELPDGSEIILDQNSEISFNKYFWNFDRNVILRGHAYFDVESGNTFEVMTRNGSVEVLGTEFNIVEDEEKFEVFCFEGRVSVKSIHHKEILLSEGMATSLVNNNLVDPFAFNKEKIAAWKNGLFYFEQESLSEVFESLSQYYNIDISVEVPIEGKNFSGVFKKAKIQTSMEIVCSSMGLSYELKENSVTITE